MRNRSWVRCHEWPSYFACAIDCGFFAADGKAALLARSIVIRGFVVADGRVALLARSIVASLAQMAEVSLRYIHGRCIDVALAGATPCPDILSA